MRVADVGLIINGVIDRPPPAPPAPAPAIVVIDADDARGEDKGNTALPVSEGDRR